MKHEPLSEKEKSIQRTKCPFGHLPTHQVCDCNIVQNKVSMCCGSKIDRPNSYYPICSECQAPIEKGGGECVEPNHSAGLHDRSCPDWKKPEYDTKAIERAAKQTHYYKEAHPEKINGAFQKLCLICRGECQKPRPHSFSMEETLEIMGLKVRSDGNRLVVVDELGAETTGAEWKHDVDPKAGIVIEYLLQNHKSISAAILAERATFCEKILKQFDSAGGLGGRRHLEEIIIASLK